jgi:hypothetical protein
MGKAETESVLKNGREEGNFGTGEDVRDVLF